MVPKIHSTGGHSFKGCMNYLLHGEKLPAAERDQATEQDNRVSWSTTGNLGTQSPAVAARVMALTAMNADKLKAEAGVSTRGRKTTKGDVMHYTLSWKDSEIKNLSKEEMKSAALASLTKLGLDTTQGKRVPKDGGRRHFADQHQYVLVCHDDKEHPHVHVMLNMVHPKTGRRLPTSNDQNKLSSWARAYQKKHNNEHLCPAREENNKARRWNEKKKKHEHYVKAEAELSRKDWEMQKGVKDKQAKKSLQEKYQSRATAIGKEQRSQKARHGKEWNDLEASHQAREQGINEQSKKDFKAGKRQILVSAKTRLQYLMAKRDADSREYRIREKTWQGRLFNTWTALKHQGSKLLNTDDGRQRFAKTFKAVFNLYSNVDSRYQSIREKHDKQEAEHHKKVNTEIAAARKTQNSQQETKLQAGREEFQQQREDVIQKHRGEDAKIKAEWQQYGKDRRAEWKELREKQVTPPAQKQEQAVKTDPSHIVPKEGSQQAAQNMDQYKAIAEQHKQNVAAQNNQGKKEDRGR